VKAGFLRAPKRSCESVAKGWLGLTLLALIFTYGDYGITWDESKHMRYGDYIFEYWFTRGEDARALTYSIDYFYGGGYDLLGSCFRKLTGEWLDPHEAMHLLGISVGWLGLVGTWKLASSLFGSRIGLFALCMLSLTPLYVGQLANNPKDIPFATGYIWGLWACQQWWSALPSLPDLRRTLILAIGLGLAASVRIAGLLLPIFFAVVLLIYLTQRAKQGRNLERIYLNARAIVVRMLAAFCGAYIVMLMAWPWALQRPLSRPWTALMRMSSFSLYERRMPFDGEMISSMEVPRTYLLHYFGFMLPETVVVGGVIGLLALLESRNSDSERRGRTLLALAVVFPPLYAALRQTPLYDGPRHFLFVLPPFCIAAAWGWSRIWRWIGTLFRASRTNPLAHRSVIVATCAAMLLLVDQARVVISTHPHQYVWFNRFSGGLAEAVARYDTDYYGNSYRDLLDDFPEQIWAAEPETYLKNVYTVEGCLAGGWIDHYLPPNFSSRPEVGKTADFHAGYTRGNCLKPRRKGKLVKEVVVEGATISAIYDMRLESSTVQRKESSRG
jgi:hypothetical protein